VGKLHGLPIARFKSAARSFGPCPAKRCLIRISRGGTPCRRHPRPGPERGSGFFLPEAFAFGGTSGGGVTGRPSRAAMSCWSRILLQAKNRPARVHSLASRLAARTPRRHGGRGSIRRVVVCRTRYCSIGGVACVTRGSYFAKSRRCMAIKAGWVPCGTTITSGSAAASSSGTVASRQLVKCVINFPPDDLLALHRGRGHAELHRNLCRNGQKPGSHHTNLCRPTRLDFGSRPTRPATGASGDRRPLPCVLSAGRGPRRGLRSVTRRHRFGRNPR